MPFWAKDIKVGYNLINARAETVHQKNHRSASHSNSDGASFPPMVSMNGSRRKQPYYITLPEDRPFAFAGLWESWASPETEIIESCTIIVTTANEQLRPIHDRMPVIITPERFDDWLDIDRPLDETRRLFKPYDGALDISSVSQHVNSVRNDDPKCIEPVLAEPAP